MAEHGPVAPSCSSETALWHVKDWFFTSRSPVSTNWRLFERRCSRFARTDRSISTVALDIASQGKEFWTKKAPKRDFIRNPNRGHGVRPSSSSQKSCNNHKYCYLLFVLGIFKRDEIL